MDGVIALYVISLSLKSEAFLMIQAQTLSGIPDKASKLNLDDEKVESGS